MAIAQKWLANRYNKPGFEIFDYNIYAVTGDGCMMEGVASEAASFAGHLRVDNLCWIWDNNHITIEGDTNITFTEDVAHGSSPTAGTSCASATRMTSICIEDALTVFRRTTGRPTFIVLDSHIGYGSPNKQGTPEAHGEPLGDAEIRLTKRAYGWPEDAQFLVPEGVYGHFAAGIGQRGATARQDWTALFAGYRDKFPDLATEIDQMSVANCRPAGMKSVRRSRRMRKEWPGARRRARCSTCCRRTSRGCSAVRRISAPPTRPR